MKTALIEATQSVHADTWANHGKFLVGRFDSDEATWPSSVAPGRPLLRVCGWGNGEGYLLVLDLQTGEGAIFRPDGVAKADLEKHRVWVCPMFEPFLEWLYEQDLSDLNALPSVVELPGAEFAMSGYRRKGVQQ